MYTVECPYCTRPNQTQSLFTNQSSGIPVWLTCSFCSTCFDAHAAKILIRPMPTTQSTWAQSPWTSASILPPHLTAPMNLTPGIVSEFLKNPNIGLGSECVHEWKEYVGLTQVYDYCTKCDNKRDNS